MLAELESLKASNVVLFGAGQKGVMIQEHLSHFGITPAYFVDNNPNSRRGVKSPEVLLGEDKLRLKIIITPSAPLYDEIKGQLYDMGLRGCIGNSLWRSIPSFKVRIDASTHCQLKCVLCDMHKPNNGSILGKGHLKYYDFKNFIDNHPYIRAVELSNFGELFLNPELINILEYAYKQNVMLTAGDGVNFNTASDEAIEALVKFKLNSMVISIDGTSQETYSTYRVNGIYSRVIENIQKLNQFKEKHGSEFPRLTWKFILMRHNEDDVIAAKEEAKKLNMDIRFSLNWDSSYKPQKIEMLKEHTGLNYLTIEEAVRENIATRVSSACYQLWDSPQINWDGRLLGCCAATRRDFGVNVFEVGLEKALGTESYLYAKQLLQGNAPFNKDISYFQGNIPCLDCAVYLNMVEQNCFLEI